MKSSGMINQLITILILAYSSLSQTSVHGTVRNIHDSQINFQNAISYMKAYLNYGEFTTYLQKDGSFGFYNIPDGIYLLTFQSDKYELPLYQVKIDEGNYKVYSLNMTSKMKQVVDTPLTITPLGNSEYFEVRAPMDVNAIIKSPFGIVIMITVAMLLCMKNMPDMEELQNAENPTQGNNPQVRSGGK